MKFYRVAYRSEGGNSGGFSWHTNKGEAEQRAREAVRNDPDEYSDEPPGIDQIEIEPTRAGLLAALQRYASHANNDP